MEKKPKDQTHLKFLKDNYSNSINDRILENFKGENSQIEIFYIARSKFPPVGEIWYAIAVGSGFVVCEFIRDENNNNLGIALISGIFVATVAIVILKLIDFSRARHRRIIEQSLFDFSHRETRNELHD